MYYRLTAARRLVCSCWPTGAILLLCMASSCEKAVVRDLASQEKKWLGTWQVTEIRTVTTDTLGTVLSTVAAPDQGSVEFREAPGGSAGAAFKPAVFEGPCAKSHLINYFEGFSATDHTVTGGRAIYWDADPDGARVLLWGIGPLSSYHRTLTLNSDDASTRQMAYTYGQLPNAPNQRVFITWSLHK